MDENRKKELDFELKRIAEEEVARRERDMMANCYIPAPPEPPISEPPAPDSPKGFFKRLFSKIFKK